MSGDTVTREYAVLLSDGSVFSDSPFANETYEHAVEQAELVRRRAELIGVALGDLPIVSRNRTVSFSEWVHVTS